MAGPVLTPLLAASVIVLRDDPFEVLLLRRHANSSFMPNAWVFPGGVAEEEDEGDLTKTAIREVEEETGLQLARQTLVPTSRWITPIGLPKRFDTIFFLGRVGREVEVRMHEAEFAGWMWITPGDALARRDLKLVLPTIKNLEQIASFPNTDALFAARRNAVLEPIQPVLIDGKPTLV